MPQARNKWIILKETENFKLLHDEYYTFEDTDLSQESNSNYLIVFKGLNKVELVTNSYANAIILLDTAENHYKAAIKNPSEIPSQTFDENPPTLN